MPLQRSLVLPLLLAVLFLPVLLQHSSSFARAQDYDDGGGGDVPHPKAEESCNGVFLTYTFVSRVKEYPRVKNATAQSYAFKSVATALNTMTEDLKAWKMFVGFQHEEILVSVSGAVVVDGTDYPARVGNGTTLAGYPQADLLNSIETAGDMEKIQVKVDLTGTQFGVKPPGVPMPKTIKLANDGFECPKPTREGSLMYVCCVKDKKFKTKKTTGKFLPRQYGDLTIAYDVLQAYDSNYLAQITLDNNNPLGRLDNWNITWEWMRGEFIYNMRGAYTYRRDTSDCHYGRAATYYKGLDFASVMNCEKKPLITDLPPERAEDTQIGKLPYCCKNGTLISPAMDPSRSKAIFQLQVYKLPPDNLNQTSLYPPQNFKIDGVVNPNYKCGPPIRVSPMEFPDPSGLMSKSFAVASWHVSCNISRPEARQSRCCVSFSAYYNDSVVPCGTCACGCPAEDEDRPACNPNARAMLLPYEALLIPSENRTAKARAWAKIKHWDAPSRLPCPDHCGVSINWHVQSNYRTGWTARITVFNWIEYTFKDWFAAVRLPKAFKGFEKVYSFNGTTVPGVNNTIFMQGLPGLNYLVGETDGKELKSEFRVPGKQQSVISFRKEDTPGIDIVGGDGFPTRVYFNGEECALPSAIPLGSGCRPRAGVLAAVLAAFVALVLLMDNIY